MMCTNFLFGHSKPSNISVFLKQVLIFHAIFVLCCSSYFQYFYYYEEVSRNIYSLSHSTFCSIFGVLVVSLICKTILYSSDLHHRNKPVENVIFYSVKLFAIMRASFLNIGIKCTHHKKYSPVVLMLRTSCSDIVGLFKLYRASIFARKCCSEIGAFSVPGVEGAEYRMVMTFSLKSPQCPESLLIASRFRRGLERKTLW